MPRACASSRRAVAWDMFKWRDHAGSWILLLAELLVTTSKALVTSSDALVTSSEQYTNIL